MFYPSCEAALTGTAGGIYLFYSFCYMPPNGIGGCRLAVKEMLSFE
jgi:hypothetical protein